MLDHEFLEGFKPVNIEAYDGTTDPGVWIEDYILHIHMARGDDLHAIKYLPLKLKGPARHWLKSLPESSIGSWEELEDACRCQNRWISGRGSRTVRLGRMVTGGGGHNVYPGSGPLDGGKTLRPA